MEHMQKHMHKTSWKGADVINDTMTICSSVLSLRQLFWSHKLSHCVFLWGSFSLLWFYGCDSLSCSYRMRTFGSPSHMHKDIVSNSVELNTVYRNAIFVCKIFWGSNLSNYNINPVLCKCYLIFITVFRCGTVISIWTVLGIMHSKAYRPGLCIEIGFIREKIFFTAMNEKCFEICFFLRQ